MRALRRRTGDASSAADPRKYNRCSYFLRKRITYSLNAQMTHPHSPSIPSTGALVFAVTVTDVTESASLNSPESPIPIKLKTLTPTHPPLQPERHSHRLRLPLGGDDTSTWGGGNGRAMKAPPILDPQRLHYHSLPPHRSNRRFQSPPTHPPILAIGSVTYTLGGDDAGLFTVNSGVVEMVADFESPADSGSNNVYNYTLIATDDDGAQTASLLLSPSPMSPNRPLSPTPESPIPIKLKIPPTHPPLPA